MMVVQMNKFKKLKLLRDNFEHNENLHKFFGFLILFTALIVSISSIILDNPYSYFYLFALFIMFWINEFLSNILQRIAAVSATIIISPALLLWPWLIYTIYMVKFQEH